MTDPSSPWPYATMTTDLLVIILLLLGLNGLGSNACRCNCQQRVPRAIAALDHNVWLGWMRWERTVQITLTSLGDAAATLLLIVLEDANLLKGLHDLAVDGAGGVDVLGGAGAAVLGGTVDLAEAADTDGLAHVDVAGDGGGADVEPVGVLRRHLLGGTGLDGINPTWQANCQLVSADCRAMPFRGEAAQRKRGTDA